MVNYDNAVRHLGYNPKILSENEKMRLLQESQRRLAGLSVLTDNSLRPQQLASLNLARAIAGPRVYAANIPPASNKVRTAGMYSRSSGKIFISPDQLEHGSSTLDTIIHELAHHTGGAGDLEEAHKRAMAEVADNVVQYAHAGRFDELMREVTW